MPKPSGSNSGNRSLFAALVAAAVGYAALRYNVFAGVPWGDFPLFVSNKGLSLASVVLIAATYPAAVSTWPGGMPPISLLSFVACVVPLGVKALSMAAVYRARLDITLSAAPEMRVGE